MLYKIIYALYRYSRTKFLNDMTPFGCSLAPTVQCNLKCKFCFERRNRLSGQKELNYDQFSALCDDLYNRGMRHVTVTDGEPLLNNNSIKKCELIVDKFWITYIVTNGTRELIDFPATYIVSLDGPHKLHNKLRGAGVFERLNRNLKKSATDKIYVLTTLNNYNRGHIEETIKTAIDLGVRGIMLNWHTPLSRKDPFWVPYHKRNQDINLILQLKDKYGPFIHNTQTEFDYLRSPDWTKNCPSRWIESVDAFGNVKRPCIFGKNAVCERCGCHVFPALHALIKHNEMTVEAEMLKHHLQNHWMNLDLDKVERVVRRKRIAP